MIGGGFITIGVLFSVLLGAGIDSPGLQRLVVSGILANWLVSMAAFFSMMGRTIFGKYIPILLTVTAFVAANLQHSPANMSCFAL